MQKQRFFKIERSMYTVLVLICVSHCGEPRQLENETKASLIGVNKPVAEKNAIALVSREDVVIAMQPAPEDAKRPRIKVYEAIKVLQTLPDGKLKEWEQSEIAWHKLNAAPGAHSSMQAQFALASYRGGVSLAFRVQDATYQPAKFLGGLEKKDHLDILLQPLTEQVEKNELTKPFALHFKLGTQKELIKLVSPEESWRETMLSSFGVKTEDGYDLEVRVPLATLTPLAAATIKKLKVRINVFNADADLVAPQLALQADEAITLDTPLQVPEAAQKRPSVRICQTSFKTALWGYENGWRCSVPFSRVNVSQNLFERENAREYQLGHTLLLTPPTLVWLRERIVAINIDGVQRGVLALLDKKETILSLMKLGVIGALDPGNTAAKDSEAEPLELPDKTWAIAVTHTIPSDSQMHGGRCSFGQRVFLSIIALKGALVSTPTNPAPEPDTPPQLAEILRITLEDCETSVANSWSISKDKKTIQVWSSVHPSRTPIKYVFREGKYQLAAP